MKIVKGDIVYLRAGKDVAGLNRLPDDARNLPMAEQIAAANRHGGVRGKVLKVYPNAGKVLVEGLNKVTKHQKPRATSGAGMVQQGGRIEKEAPIPVSRVMLVCPSCDKPTRIGMKVTHDTRQTLTGTKSKAVNVRVCKQCGDEISRPTEQQ